METLIRLGVLQLMAFFHRKKNFKQIRRDESDAMEVKRCCWIFFFSTLNSITTSIQLFTIHFHRLNWENEIDEQIQNRYAKSKIDRHTSVYTERKKKY